MDNLNIQASFYLYDNDGMGLVGVFTLMKMEEKLVWYTKYHRNPYSSGCRMRPGEVWKYKNIEYKIDDLCNKWAEEFNIPVIHRQVEVLPLVMQNSNPKNGENGFICIPFDEKEFEEAVSLC